MTNEFKVKELIECVNRGKVPCKEEAEPKQLAVQYARTRFFDAVQKQVKAWLLVDRQGARAATTGCVRVL